MRIRTVTVQFLIALIPASAFGQAAIEEIVVTAQKREQNVQAIGASISVLTDQDVTDLRVRTPADIANHVANVNAKNVLGVSQPVITIRGIGMNDFIDNNDQNAGIYVDEVFLASASLMSLQLFDIERVEVLRGPQGTLYGRNTTAGAINFLSRTPSDVLESALTAEFASYEQLDLEGVVSGPIGESVKGRLALHATNSNDGPWHNAVTGEDFGELDRWAARGTLEWGRTETFDALATIQFGEDTSDSRANWKTIGLFDPATFTPCAAALAGNKELARQTCVDLVGYQDPYSDPFTGEWDRIGEVDAEQSGATLRLNWTLPQFMLTSITGYQSLDRFETEDADGSPFVGLNVSYQNEVDQLSEELRLVSIEPWVPQWLPGDGVDWMAGVFWHNDERTGAPSQNIVSRDWFNDTIEVNWQQESQSAALFAHFNWYLSSSWQFIFGARYTWEEKQFAGRSESLAPFPGGSFLTGLTTPFLFASTDDDISNSETTATGGVQWTPNEDLLVYLTASKGFKSGGFAGGFTGTPEELLPFDEEELYSYEGGVKITSRSGTLQASAAIFYYDYDGMQISAIPLDAIIPTVRLTNSEDVDVRGLEADLLWRPADAWYVKGGVGWLDHENNDPRPEFNGKQLPNAPNLTFNGLVRYEHALKNGRTIAPMVDFSYTDDMFKEVENKPLLTSEAYWLLDARLTLSLSDRIEFSLWGQNLTDEEYVTEAFDQELLGDFIFLYGMPRTYGVSFSYRSH